MRNEELRMRNEKGKKISSSLPPGADLHKT
jgi:hypothetical protein